MLEDVLLPCSLHKEKASRRWTCVGGHDPGAMLLNWGGSSALPERSMPIVVLPPEVAAEIAAGEVIERAASGASRRVGC